MVNDINDIIYLNAPREEDLTLAVAKRILAGVSLEVEAGVVVNRASRLQASPLETRVLFGITLVVGI